MVEMRWVWQHFGRRGYVKKERVLQYRSRVLLEIAPGVLTGSKTLWTEWQDVPEEEAPSDS